MKKSIVARMITIVGCLFIVAMADVSPAKNIVVIDPAHGGDENGVRLSGDEYEKDIVLAIAKGVRTALDKSEKLSIVLTRTDDATVSSEERKDLAKRAGADLFISLHINAGFGKQAEGYEVGISGLTETKPVPDSQEVVQDMVRNKYINDSVRFAQLAQRAMEKIFPRQGRGIRNADFAILADVDCPAVLLEMGFATNIENKKVLRKSEIQKEIADEIAISIHEYFRE